MLNAIYRIVIIPWIFVLFSAVVCGAIWWFTSNRHLAALAFFMLVIAVALISVEAAWRLSGPREAAWQAAIVLVMAVGLIFSVRHVLQVNSRNFLPWECDPGREGRRGDVPKSCVSAPSMDPR